MRVERLTPQVCFHGEGPVWHDMWGGLRWVDMLAGDVLSLLPDGSVARMRVGTIAAAIRPRREGGMVAALERRFALFDRDGRMELLPEVWRDAGIRFNDGGCDPEGRFYCGSMAYDHRAGAAALYRLSPGGETVRILDGLTISNGLAWTGDGRRAFLVDTPTRRVDVFDYDGGALSGRRPFVTIPEGAGYPDGLTVDGEEGVWVALYGGSAVHRYDSGGSLDAVVTLPTPKPTACTLGGERLSTLFVTTTQEGLPAGSDPGAGCLYTVDVAVAGLAAREFAG